MPVLRRYRCLDVASSPTIPCCSSASPQHHLMREEARALRAWLKVRGSFPGPIFLSKQKRPIDRTTLHLLMKKYGAAAGIPAKLRHFHVLGPTFALRGFRSS